MVDTSPLAPPAANGRPVLPEKINLGPGDFRAMPSPGAMRDLKAQTGRTFSDLAGPDADQADQFQTIIWIKLRRLHPGLRWDDCADVAPVVTEEDLASLDPTTLASSATSPPSAASGA